MCKEESTYARKSDIGKESEGGSESIISPWATLLHHTKLQGPSLCHLLLQGKVKEKVGFRVVGCAAVTSTSEAEHFMKDGVHGT